MRAVLWMGSVVVALVAVVGASRLWAVDKEKKPAPRTRIGLVNLAYVIKNYDKFQQFQMEIKELAEPFHERDAELRAKLRRLRDEDGGRSILPTIGKDRNEAAEKEELEERVKKIQRELEENTEKAKKKIGKESDHEMRIIYLDIYEATQNYATAHDLDLVLHYNDAITKEDFLSVHNIARKMNTGALMPLYTKLELDISQDLVTLLNQKMHKK